MRCGSYAIADVAQPEQTHRYVQTAVHRYGGIDIFVDNAGIEGVVKPIHKYPIEIFDKVISFVTFKRMFALELEKEILKRRGIFKNNRMRVSPYKLVWDKVDQEEFEVLFNNLKPYFRV